MTKSVCQTILSGTLWHCKGVSISKARFEEIRDGAMAIDSQGKILAVGEAPLINKQFQAKKTFHFSNRIILPGFVDTHIHFPQMNQIGCHGESLLGWLNKYIYPEEIRMSQKRQAQRFAPVFFNELFKNGTTTSLIFSSSDYGATDALFQNAHKSGARAMIGKVSMDRLAPEPLKHKASKDKEESERLIDKWHEKDGRLFYALTPRFSPACSPQLLKMLGTLVEKHPKVRIQTHFSENIDEIKLVHKLFPKAKDYLQTYEDFGLLGTRTVLAHCIHASSSEINRIAKKQAHVSHCPTSNLFLGSGLFPLNEYVKRGINVSIGSDVGAGTSFSIWTTLGSAYTIQRLRHQDISTEQLFFLATLGGAKALGLENSIGNFEVGKQADVQVIDWTQSDILKFRMENSKSAEERFFSCLFHFDKSLIDSVFVNGKKVFTQEAH